jgi:hypothetical protein
MINLQKIKPADTFAGILWRSPDKFPDKSLTADSSFNRYCDPKII